MTFASNTAIRNMCTPDCQSVYCLAHLILKLFWVILFSDILLMKGSLFVLGFFTPLDITFTLMGNNIVF